MSEKQTVTMGGKPLELSESMVKVGDKAPDFTALDNNMGEFKLSSTRGKVRILSAVTSLDTSICDIETRRFNEEAAKLGEEVQILTISMDLPFAQKRWCAAAGIEQVKTLSDHKDAAFGLAYGMLIPSIRLLARAIFVLDGDDVIRYIQVVPEIAQEPDYEAVLLAVKELI